MQFVAGGRGADRSTYGRGILAGDTHDDLALGQLARGGADGLLGPRTGAIDEGFRADPLDGLDCQVQGDAAASCGFAGDRKVFRSDAQDTGLGSAAAVAGELRTNLIACLLYTSPSPRD